MQSPIQMQATLELKPEALEISYVVKNESSETVLLLDQLWNRKMKGFDPSWAFVEIRGSKALVKRIMETKPVGLVAERPPVPYGRMLEPGSSLEGKISLPVPMAASNPYAFYVTPDLVDQEVDLTDVGFMVAWTTVPPEPLDPSMRRVEREGMVLQPFTYYYLEGKQRFLTSEPQKMKLKGIAKVPPAK